ncbi:uncharacterized protein TNCV_1446781 [Trichonephila clavipes]|nr:uncharacterized protein TNCV_1446781 [Trichonephila clavipes]
MNSSLSLLNTPPVKTNVISCGIYWTLIRSGTFSHGIVRVLTVHVHCHRRQCRLREVIVGSLASEDSHQVVTLQRQDLQFVPHHTMRCHCVRVVKKDRLPPPRDGGERFACKRENKVLPHLFQTELLCNLINGEL